jgi:hypothetical protein
LTTAETFFSRAETLRWWMRMLLLPNLGEAEARNKMIKWVVCLG